MLLLNYSGLGAFDLARTRRTRNRQQIEVCGVCTMGCPSGDWFKRFVDNWLSDCLLVGQWLLVKLGRRQPSTRRAVDARSRRILPPWSRALGDWVLVSRTLEGLGHRLTSHRSTESASVTSSEHHVVVTSTPLSARVSGPGCGVTSAGGDGDHEPQQQTGNEQHAGTPRDSRTACEHTDTAPP